MTDLTLPIHLDPDSPPDDTLHVTASGLPVRVYATDGGDDRPIHGAIYIGGEWLSRTWLPSGRYEMSAPEHRFDLRDRPKRGWWIGVYTKGEQRFAASFPSERDALIYNAGEGWKHFALTYLAEGDGLDTPADPPLWVDWAKVSIGFNWAGATTSGDVRIFEERPEQGVSIWRSELRSERLPLYLYRLAPGFDWRSTLIQRPEGV